MNLVIRDPVQREQVLRRAMPGWRQKLDGERVLDLHSMGFDARDLQRYLAN